MKYTLLILFTFFILLQCKEQAPKKIQQPEPKPRQTQGNSFYYYPRANVYYDIEEKKYLFFDSLKNNWEQKQQLSPEEIENLGKKIIIENPPVPVYIDNQQHRIIYSTALYTSADDLKKKFIEDSLKTLPARRVTKKKVPPSTEIAKEKKPKRGLKRLFQKIFH